MAFTASCGSGGTSTSAPVMVAVTRSTCRHGRLYQRPLSAVIAVRGQVADLAQEAPR